MTTDRTPGNHRPGQDGQPVLGETEVLVVGAGPVGLLAAVELRRLGVGVRVVDRATHGSTRSKATTLWPRQLELFDRIGVTDEILDRGHRIDRVTFHGSAREIASIELGRAPGTHHPYGASIPQPLTEEILTRALAREGVVVERGVELLSIAQDEDGVDAVVTTADGATGTLRARYLVGADGAHSTVRSVLGIPFEDDNPPVTFAITDAHVDGDVPSRTLGYHYSPAGALGLVPLGGTTFRIAIGVPPGTPEHPPRELFQEALDRRTTLRGRVGELPWSATFTVRFRIAERFCAGRAVLVGDAAHIMSPAGGQGMNTGIQDAVALAWRIAAALESPTSAGADAHLAAYSAERHADARRVSDLSAALTRWGLLRAPAARVVRDTLARAASAAGIVDRRLGPRLGQLDTRYGPSRRSRAGLLAAGDRFPGTFAPPGALVHDDVAAPAREVRTAPGREAGTAREEGAPREGGAPREAGADRGRASIPAAPHLDPLRSTVLVWPGAGAGAGALVRLRPTDSVRTSGASGAPGRPGRRWAAALERARDVAARTGSSPDHVSAVLDPAKLPPALVARLPRGPAVYLVRPDGHVQERFLSVKSAKSNAVDEVTETAAAVLAAVVPVARRRAREEQADHAPGHLTEGGPATGLLVPEPAAATGRTHPGRSTP